MTDPDARSDRPDPCYYCAGACCESLVFPLAGPQRDFLETRGQVVEIHGKPHSEVESTCPMLDSCGRCRIHAQKYFPKTCATFEVGGHLCRLTVARRRRGHQRDLIEAELDRLATWPLPPSAQPPITTP